MTTNTTAPATDEQIEFIRKTAEQGRTVSKGNILVLCSRIEADRERIRELSAAVLFWEPDETATRLRLSALRPDAGSE